MEKVEAAAEKRRRRQRSAALSVASSLCSVVSVAFCVLLSVNAADIRSRVTGLEAAGGQHSSFLCAPGFTLEDFNSLVEQSVDERLSQVSPPVSTPRVVVVVVIGIFLSLVAPKKRKERQHLFSLQYFSAPLRISSRSGRQDKPHLSAAARQVGKPAANCSCVCIQSEWSFFGDVCLDDVELCVVV